ncbi:hypothetical protein ABEB36_002983 [Hypothenemus hampei]|uniref:Ig-like domain-containing protein n=1 Tax=Hypothenemus hampei TaxID=57062 RepID=A0ABD1F9H5_HYPHA
MKGNRIAKQKDNKYTAYQHHCFLIRLSSGSNRPMSTGLYPTKTLGPMNKMNQINHFKIFPELLIHGRTKKQRKTSVDGRNRDSISNADQWSNNEVFSNRAYFMQNKEPAELVVDHIRGSDQGVYRCRVDFKLGQTRNSKVNLTVIVYFNKVRAESL